MTKNRAPRLALMACATAFAMVAITGCGDDTAPLTSAQRAASPNLGTMQIGDTRVLTLAQAQNGLLIPKGADGAHYLFFVANNNSADASAVSSYDVRGDYSTPNSLLARANGEARLRPPNNAYANRFEASLRARELRNLAPLMRSARLTRATGATRGLRLDVVPGAPVVGTTLTINTPGTTCTDVHPTTARVTAVSAHAIVMSDLASPPGGFDDTAYTAIAQEFENIIYPTVTDYFGTPTDFDDNGRVMIYFTPYINSLSTRNPDDGYIGGMFFRADLLPQSSCPSSNGGEIFYVLAPDADGTISQPFSRDDVRSIARGVLGHEFVHMINAGHRLTNPSGPPFESLWLDEGLAHTSEHIVGRAFAHIPAERMLTSNDLGAIDDATFSAFFAGNIINTLLYLQRPDTIGPISSDEHVAGGSAARGAIWSLLQFAGDQFSHGDRKTFLRALSASADTGVTNLATQSGVSIDSLLAHWQTTLLAAPLAVGVDPAYRYTSYQWFSVFSKLFQANVYPLTVTLVDPDSAALSVTVAHTGAAYFHAVQSPTNARRIKITAVTPGVPLDPNFRIGIIRTN